MEISCQIPVMGVSMTLFSPYFWYNPFVTLYAPWYCATSSPNHNLLEMRITHSWLSLDANL